MTNQQSEAAAKPELESTTIRAAVYRVGAEMVVQDIPKSLESYQQLVGGYIEVARLPDDLALVCNDEGINYGMPPNRAYRFYNGAMGLAFGDFFVCRTEGSAFGSLTDDDIQRLPSIISRPRSGGPHQSIYVMEDTK